MHVKRRRLPNFEACSVALFASLALGSATLPARAQAAAPSTRSLASTAAAPNAGRTTLRLKPRVASRDHSPAVPDGSVSSPGFDEALK
jgi:hypothetical protein